jgi:hypothetical protein
LKLFRTWVQFPASPLKRHTCLKPNYIEELEMVFDVGTHSMLLGEDYEVVMKIRNFLKKDSNSLFRKNESI